ncbi:MAG: hypothetical protein RL757_2802 [Bacteroidota bacterium]|jgi:hypothetical protein
MSLGIYYRGKLKSKSLIVPIIEELSEICKINNWSYRISDRTNSTLKFVDEIESLKMQGITFSLGKEGNLVQFSFDPEGFLRDAPMAFLKTYEKKDKRKKYDYIFAQTLEYGIENHIVIIQLLRYLKKKYFKVFDIKDMGGFYPYQNREMLEERFDSFLKVQTVLNEIVEHGNFSGTQEEITQQISDAVNRSMGENYNIEIVSGDISTQQLSEMSQNLLAKLIDLVERMQREYLDFDDQNSENNENEDDDEDENKDYDD